MQSVEEQVTASLQNYMGEVMGTFSTEVGQALQTQITSAMQQIAAQITGGESSENVMRQAMTRSEASCRARWEMHCRSMRTHLQARLRWAWMRKS